VPGVRKGVRRGPVGPPGPLELAALLSAAATAFLSPMGTRRGALPADSALTPASTSWAAAATGATAAVTCLQVLRRRARLFAAAGIVDSPRIPPVVALGGAVTSARVQLRLAAAAKYYNVRYIYIVGTTWIRMP
jgi:hypothetical protein